MTNEPVTSSATASLFDDFAMSCRRLPLKTALICGDQRYCYHDLDRCSTDLARQLSGHGVRDGDRVAMFLTNGAGFVIGLLAVMRLGAVAVPINALSRSNRVRAILHDVQAAALLTQIELESEWIDSRDSLSTGETGFSMPHMVLVEHRPAEGDIQWRVLPGPATQDLTPSRPSQPAATRNDPALSAILYTSGSTGSPKGVMLTRHNMRWASQTVIDYLGLREDDVILCALQLAFSYGLYQVLMAWRLGATVVLERDFSFPAQVLSRIERDGVTVLPGVPAMFGLLLSMKSSDDAAVAERFRTLRMLTCAAASLPEAVAHRLRLRFPRARLWIMYGQTECKRISFVPPEDLPRRADSIGRGLPGQDHWLIDDQGRRLPSVGTGELVVRGPHVMAGYWRKPIETDDRLRDAAPYGFPGERVLLTGDVVRVDEQGWMYFVGRLDDIIKVGGEKVSPREVENVIHQLDAVHEALVLGVEDPQLGQVVKAVVVLAAGRNLSERDVIRHCLGQLARHQAPRLVEFSDRLPRTDSGKVVRPR